MKKISSIFIQTTKQHPRLFLFVITFFICALPIINITTLNVSDELGTIANAAYLAGYDWSTFIESANLAFYRYGSSIIYIPIFLIFKEPIYIYKVSLILCSLLVSFIPVIAYNIALLWYFPENKTNIFMVSLLIGLFPVNLLWCKQLWSESMLMLLPWVVLYLLMLLTSSRKHSYLYEILVILLSYYAYTVHSRGIALIIAVVAFDILIFFREKKWIINPITIVVVMIIAFILDGMLDNYFKAQIWGDLNTNVNNTTNSVIKDLLSQKEFIFSFRGIKVFVKMILSWLITMFMSSYGLVLVAVALCYQAVKRFLCRRKYTLNKKDYFIFFSVIYFIFSMIIGLLFFFPAGVNLFYGNATERIDKLLYVRYVSGAFSLMVFIALYDIIVNKKKYLKRYKWFILGSTIILLCIYAVFLSDNTTEGLVSFVQILPVPLFLSVVDNGVEYILGLNYHIIVGLCIAACILGIIYLIKGKREKLYTGLVVGISFMATYIWAVGFIIWPMDRYYNTTLEKTKNVLEELDCSQKYPYIVVRIPRTAYSYQFAFPDYEIVLQDDDITEENVIIVDNNIDNYKGGNYYIIKNVQSNIILKGEDIVNYFNMNGFETEKII